MAVGVLTAAPWHNSIGDIATAEVTLSHLAAAGIPARHVTNPDEDVDFVVVGGGELLRSPSPSDRGQLMKRFQPRGDHILNACGVADGFEDFDFLSDYRLVTVRDNDAMERIQGVRPDVECVPCPATLVQPYEWDFARDLVHGHRHLSHLQPGEYVVVHRHPALAPLSRIIDLPVLVVDAQAWRRYAWRGAGDELPATHSTRVAQTFIANSAAVITNSLHLAIFAIGAGTPFTAVDFGDAQSSKVRRYLRRAGLEELLLPVRMLRREVRRVASLSAPVARRLGYPDVVEFALARSGQVSSASSAERARSTAHLDRLVAACLR